MSETAPLVVDSAEYAAFGEARIVVEVTGRWIDRPPVPSGESALLVVDDNGLVHRFAEISAAVEAAEVGDEYLGSFVIPAQFRRRIMSPTALRAGGVTVTVPGATLAGEGAPDTGALDADAGDTDAPGEAASAYEPVEAYEQPPAYEPPIAYESPIAYEPPAVYTPPPGYQPGPAESPVPGALNPVVRRDPDPVVETLRETLSQRVAEEARMRRELGELRSQLEARARNSDRLEHAQSELRAAVLDLSARLEEDGAQRVALESSNAALEAANASLSAEVASLRAALEQAQAELMRIADERDGAVSELDERYAELAATKISQETALEEVDELRRELERGGAELAEIRERFGASEVEEAESLLAETRALTAKLINRGGQSDQARNDAGD